MTVVWPVVSSFAEKLPSSAIDLAEVYEFSDDAEQISKTWENGYLFIPGPVIGEFIYGKIGTSTIQSRLTELPDDKRFPLIVYLHDAGGVSKKVYRLIEVLEGGHFAMVLPDSYARDNRQFDCEGKSWRPKHCAMSPDVYLARRSELIHAVEMVKQLSWVDQGNIFLMGSGEGAVAVALWGGEVDVSGYVVINWSCTAPAEMPWLQGLRLPSNRPTLVLTTRENQWVDEPGWDGSCADKARGGAEIKSLVLDSSNRDVFGLPQGREAIIEFLYANLRAPTN